MAQIRLDKYLADAGQGTRSEVKLLIKKGLVQVDGVVVRKSDIKIDSEGSVVLVDGKQVSYSEVSYYMLHKPAGVVSATKDKVDRTVVDLIKEDKRRDLFPVGRLDKDTEGLLVITNDGKLANNLLAPGKHVAKEYFAVIEGAVTEKEVKLFAEGVDIGDDKPTLPASLSILDKEEGLLVGNVSSIDKAIEGLATVSYIKITITEGRYHQIKRMFEAVDMRVVYLKRISMGRLKLDNTLNVGAYRKLTEDELKLIKED